MTHPNDAYLETLGRMEKDIAAVDLTAAAASIAISLKRIADGIDRIDATLCQFGYERNHGR